MYKFVVDLLFNLTALTLLYVVLSQSQTVIKSSGPYGGKVLSINVPSFNVLLASTETGLYRSDNDGKSWTLLIIPKRPIISCFLPLQGTRILAGTSNGLFVSTDTGKAWNRLANVMISESVTSIVESKKSIFVGTENGNVFESTDSGGQWQRIMESKKFGPIRAIEISDDIIFIASAKHRLFFSTDHGKRWLSREVPTQGYELRCLMATKGGFLFVGSAGGGILRSNDRGTTWAPKQKGFATKIINRFALTREGNIIACTDVGGVFESKDNGEQWHSFGFARQHPSALTVDEQNRVFVGSERGLFCLDLKKLDEGPIWNQVGVPNVSISCLLLKSMGGILAGTTAEGIYTSADSGMAWSKTSKGLTSPMVTCIAQYDDSTFLAGTLPNPPHVTDGGVHISIDSGKTWKPIGLINIPIYAMQIGSGNIVVGTNRGLFRSGDVGKMWTPYTPLLKDTIITSLSLTKSGDLIAGTVSGLFLHEKDKEEWEKIMNTGHEISALAVNSRGYIFAVSNNKLQRSEDKGITWTMVSTPPQIQNMKSLVLGASEEMYLAGNEGLFRSGDGGASWSKIEIGDSPKAINTLLLTDTSKMILGTDDQGVFVK